MWTAAVPASLLVSRGSSVAVRALPELESGAPGMLQIGAWETLPGMVATELAGVTELLRSVAAVTVAVGAPPEAAQVAGACDLAAETQQAADGWAREMGRAPQALCAAAWLLRRAGDDTWDGLVAESATYAALQAGPELGAWLAGRGPRPTSEATDRSRRVSVSMDDGVCEIVLTRPGRHNALDARMRDELWAALEMADGARAVIVRGEGPSFCSGGDLDEFGTATTPAGAHGIRMSRSLPLRFAELGPRLVVGVHGWTLGAGVELAAFAARVVASEDVRVGLPEAGLGLVPGAGGTVSMRRRAGRARVLELLLTGEQPGAAKALEWRLVDEVVAGPRLVSRVRELAGCAP